MNLEYLSSYFSALRKNSGAARVSIIRDDAMPQGMRHCNRRSLSQPKMIGPPCRPLRRKSEEDLCDGFHHQHHKQGKRNEEISFSSSPKQNEVFSEVTKRPTAMSIKRKMLPYTIEQLYDVDNIILEGGTKTNDRRLSEDFFVQTTTILIPEKPTKSSRWNAHTTPIRRTLIRQESY